MNRSKNRREMKLLIYAMMLTTVSRMILMFSYDLTSLTILMILKALTTVAADEKLDPDDTNLRMIPASPLNTTIISKIFQDE